MDEARERFEAIFRRCERPVLAYALRRATAEDARDAAAEAFVAAWRRREELPDDPLPWLIGATRKALANRRRMAVRQARLVERLVAEPATAAPVADAIADESLRRAFARLQSRDREALALLAWEGLSPAQAAASLGCTPAAFRVRAHRARRRLESALAQEAEGDPYGLRTKEAS